VKDRGERIATIRRPHADTVVSVPRVAGQELPDVIDVVFPAANPAAGTCGTPGGFAAGPVTDGRATLAADWAAPSTAHASTAGAHPAEAQAAELSAADADPAELSAADASTTGAAPVAVGADA
jgi:hypothetical protein